MTITAGGNKLSMGNVQTLLTALQTMIDPNLSWIHEHLYNNNNNVYLIKCPF